MTVTQLTWDERIDAVWDASDARPEEETIALVRALVAERPAGDAAALYEHASAYDFVGDEAAAEPLYREALAAGLDDHRRPRAVIQLASTLRNLGRADQAVDLLQADIAAAHSNDRGVRTEDGLGDARVSFLCLALIDLGRSDEAAALSLMALARHLPEYSRAVSRYVEALSAQ